MITLRRSAGAILIKDQPKLLIIGIFVRDVARKGNWKPELSTCRDLSYEYPPGLSRRWQAQGFDRIRMGPDPEVYGRAPDVFQTRHDQFLRPVQQGSPALSNNASTGLGSFIVRCLFSMGLIEPTGDPVTSQQHKKAFATDISYYDSNIKITRLNRSRFVPG